MVCWTVPKLEADGKWRVSYEVIGNPPNVSVPTHWAKVILTSKGGMPGQPGVQTSLGAFAMPNAVIPDEEPLTKFIVPVEAVEKAGELHHRSLCAVYRLTSEWLYCSSWVDAVQPFAEG